MPGHGRHDLRTIGPHDVEGGLRASLRVVEHAAVDRAPWSSEASPSRSHGVKIGGVAAMVLGLGLLLAYQSGVFAGDATEAEQVLHDAGATRNEQSLALAQQLLDKRGQVADAVNDFRALQDVDATQDSESIETAMELLTQHGNVDDAVKAFKALLEPWKPEVTCRSWIPNYSCKDINGVPGTAEGTCRCQSEKELQCMPRTGDDEGKGDFLVSSNNVITFGGEDWRFTPLCFCPEEGKHPKHHSLCQEFAWKDRSGAQVVVRPGKFLGQGSYGDVFQIGSLAAKQMPPQSGRARPDSLGCDLAGKLGAKTNLVCSCHVQEDWTMPESKKPITYAFSDMCDGVELFQAYGGGHGNAFADTATRVEIMAQMVAILTWMVDLKTCHLDIKAENMLINLPALRKQKLKKGIMKLFDFDSAFVKGTTPSMNPIFTPELMPPEQRYVKEIPHAFDIYSFGVNWFEMLNGNILQYPGDRDKDAHIKVGNDIRNQAAKLYYDFTLRHRSELRAGDGTKQAYTDIDRQRTDMGVMAYAMLSNEMTWRPLLIQLPEGKWTCPDASLQLSIEVVDKAVHVKAGRQMHKLPCKFFDLPDSFSMNLAAGLKGGRPDLFPPTPAAECRIPSNFGVQAQGYDSAWPAEMRVQIVGKEDDNSEVKVLIIPLEKDFCREHKDCFSEQCQQGSFTCAKDPLGKKQALVDVESEGRWYRATVKKRLAGATVAGAEDQVQVQLLDLKQVLTVKASAVREAATGQALQSRVRFMTLKQEKA